MAKRGLSDFVGGAGATAGGTVLARLMRVSDIQTDPELSSLFHINEETLAEIIQSMKEDGYDKAEPLVVWRGRGVVVDGHTRLKAAREAGIFEVPVEEKAFEDMNEAKWYAFKRQADRRNLTQAEIYKAATELQTKLNRDGTGRAVELLAKRLSVSASTIGHARVIEARADEETIEAVKAGNMSINQAYQQVRRNKEADEDEEMDAEERKYFEQDDGGSEWAPPSVSAAPPRQPVRRHEPEDAEEYGEDTADEEDADAEERKDFEQDDAGDAGSEWAPPSVSASPSRQPVRRYEPEDAEEYGEDTADEEDATAETGEYTPPAVPFNEVTAVLLNGGEKAAAEMLVEEFIPEDERGRFWDLFPPGMAGGWTP
jgi:ParB family chromosome partitioning protein